MSPYMGRIYEAVHEFMALEADGDCVSLEAYLNSVDGSVLGFCRTCGIKF